MRLARLGAGAAVSFVLVGSVGGVGCSQSPSHGDPFSDPTLEARRTSSTEQAIQSGSLDGAAHPFAVGVCGGQKGNCQSFCSGTLILPNLVVTARHCVNHTSKVINCDASPTPKFGIREGANWITTSDNMMQASAGWHQVNSVVVPSDDTVCGHDIALLILKDLVPASEATPVIPGVQYPMTDFNRYSSHKVTAIGFGNTGPTGFSAGTRHIRSKIDILCTPDDPFIPCPAGFNENEFYTGDGTCEGDSGSSAFDNPSLLAGGKPLSFGVLSRGGDNAGDAGQPATLCKGGLYTRLDKYRDLVIQAAESASSNWTLYPKPVPDWTIYVPPPPDAGAPDAGPKGPRADGTACAANEECKSKVCADTGAGKACTHACDETVTPTTCQDGYVCKGAVCVQDLGGDAPAPAPATTPAAATTTTSGCSVTGPGRAPGDVPVRTVGIGAALALLLGARRRRDRHLK